MFERLDRLPLKLRDNANLTAVEDNLMVFKVNLVSDDAEQWFVVTEYHKGRMEPYPQAIKVYQKQKVELYDSKFYLSVYPTQESMNIYYIAQ